MKKQSAFKTQKDFFNYLIANKKDIISQKMAALKFADCVSFEVSELPISKVNSDSAFKDDLSRGKITRTIIGNTYNWLDNHDDVHLNNVFADSIAASHDKIWHLHDHIQQTTAKVGKPISIYEKSIAWKYLGVNKDGNTMALFMDSNIQKEYNKSIYNQYLNKEIDQHSVAMYYEKMDLALNDPESKSEYTNWLNSIYLLGNPEKAKDQGFYFVVSKARLKEISAVLMGSNELTPTLDNAKADVEKQVCPSCGADVEPNENDCCPECDMPMKEKPVVSFFTKFARELAK